MSGKSQQRARLLLVLFATGGLLVPVFHRIDHGFHLAAHRAAATQQTGHVHTDYPSFSVALKEIAHHDLVCVLCTSVTLGAGVREAGIAPAALRASSFTEGKTPLSAAFHLQRLIRGPPRSA